MSSDRPACVLHRELLLGARGPSVQAVAPGQTMVGAWGLGGAASPVSPWVWFRWSSRVTRIGEEGTGNARGIPLCMNSMQKLESPQKLELGE